MKETYKGWPAVKESLFYSLRKKPLPLLQLLCFICILASTTSTNSDHCNTYTDCASCAEIRECAWQIETGSCTVISEDLRSSDVIWEDTCPTIGAKDKTDEFLANWMKHLMVLDGFRSATLLELALAGTHDTLTYDLSLEVSDGGIDNHNELAQFLHDHEKIIPRGGADFVRQQAQTQALTVTEQLENGIRFLDLRMMYEYSARKNEKTGIHCTAYRVISPCYPISRNQELDGRSSIRGGGTLVE